MQASSFGTNRYQSNPTIGPITPVFRSRYSNQSPISKGESQLSVNSNPFDDEYDTISEIGSPERSSIRHSARKKRRAPQPPVSVSMKFILSFLNKHFLILLSNLLIVHHFKHGTQIVSEKLREEIMA